MEVDKKISKITDNTIAYIYRQLADAQLGPDYLITLLDYIHATAINLVSKDINKEVMYNFIDTYSKMLKKIVDNNSKQLKSN